MSARSIVRRYAAALFDVTRKAGTTAQARQALDGLAQLIEQHADLRRVVTSPAIPVTVKRDILLGVIDAAGGTSAEVRRTVTMLAERDRLAELPGLAAAFADRLMDADRVVRAEIVTAVPLTDASRAALSDALGRATGKSVTMHERVDPDIVGGVIARVGGFVYDASITRQLERLRDTLTANR